MPCGARDRWVAEMTVRRALRRKEIPLAVAAALVPGLAWAQGAVPEGTVQLPTVNVEATGQTATSPVRGFVAERAASATKTDTPLLETPQSISVITRDRIDAQAIRSVSEALRYTPGVLSEMSGFDPRFDSVMIRGFNARPSQYLDGMRLLRTFGPTAIEQYGLERLEVVRGPSSVLYGQTVPGGLVNMVSKRPTETPFGEVNLSAGSHDRFQGGFDLGGPLTEDGTLLYRVTGLVRNSDTEIDHVGDDRYFIAPALTWRPTADTSLTLLGRFQYDQNSSPIGLPAQGTLLPNVNGRIPRSRFAGEPDYNRSDVTQTSIGWNFEHQFDDVWTVRQNSRYMHNTVKYNSLYVSALEADQFTIRRGSLVQRETSDTLNLDNQVQARFTTGPIEHTVLAGLEYRQFWGNTQSYFGTAPTLNIFNPGYGAFVPDSRLTAVGGLRTNNNQHLAQTGLYLQDQLRYGNWLLTVGGRQDWAESRTVGRVTRARTSQDDDAFTGRVALMYVSDIGLAPYVSYSTSFDPVVGSYNAGRGGGAFQPTEGEQYEAGIKYQPPGMNSFITASVFQLTQTNVSTRDPLFPNSSVQTGEVRVRGAELEAVASLARGLNVIGAYTYLDGEITKANDGTVGNRPGLVPQHAASLWADYRMGEGTVLPGLGFGAGVRYTGSLYGDNANVYRSPSVTLADASVSYEFGNYRLSVNGSNIFDKRYVASCTGATYCYYGTGRTVIGTLAYRW